MMPQHPHRTPPVGTAFLAPDLRIAHVDQQFATSSGWPRDAHAGCTLGDVLPEIAPLIEPLLRHALATGTPVIDAALPPTAPEQPSCLVSCYPVQSRAGGLVGLDLVLRAAPADAAAPASAPAEQLGYDALHAIAAHVPVGIALFDGADVRLRWTNAFFQNLFDEPRRSSMLGNQLEHFSPQAVATGFVDVVRAVAATHQPFMHAEYQHHGGRRDTSYWHVTLLPLDVPNQAVADVLLVLTDITDATHARHAAEALTAQLTAVLQQLPAGVIIAEAPSERVTIGNAAAQRILGAPMQSAAPLEASSAAWKLLHADGSPYAARELPLVRALRHGETVQGDEAYVRRDDGTLATLLLNAAPVQNAAGAITSGVMTLLDISSRVATEQALRASEERLHLALNAGQMGTWELDLAEQTIQCSESTNRLFGLPHTGTPGPHLNYLNRVHPDDRAQVLSSIARAVKDGVEHIVEYRLLLPDNQIRWLTSRGIAARNADGQPHTLRGAVIDITQRRQAERRQEFLIEASKILGSSFDYHTALVQVIQLVVQAFADMCIVELRAADGSLELLDVVHAVSIDAALTNQLRQQYLAVSHNRGGAAHALHGGRATLFAHVDDAFLKQAACNATELDLLRALNPRSAMLLPLIVRDHVVGSIAVAMSETTYTYTQTDLAMAEDLARRTSVMIENAQLYREAQAALQARNSFVSIAAHELKTPLTGLLGQAQLLQRRIARVGDPAGRDARAAGIIYDQAQRLNTMITTLLDMSRIDRGQLAIRRALFDFGALVQHVIDELLPALHQHSMVYTPPPQPLMIVGDAVRLEQVLRNLINNAVKYSPRGGEVVACVHQKDAQVVFSVTDQGIGIPQAATKDIFEQFFRVENDATEHIVGFGIGLYVVRQIVAQHGGEVSVSSVEGQGSTFTCVLPLGSG